jgi:hypothetical protein
MEGYDAAADGDAAFDLNFDHCFEHGPADGIGWAHPR